MTFEDSGHFCYYFLLLLLILLYFLITVKITVLKKFNYRNLNLKSQIDTFYVKVLIKYFILRLINQYGQYHLYNVLKRLLPFFKIIVTFSVYLYHKNRHNFMGRTTSICVNILVNNYRTFQISK